MQPKLMFKAMDMEVVALCPSSYSSRNGRIVDFDVKISDFGLAMKLEKRKKRKEAPCLRRTALVHSWNWQKDSNVHDLLCEIAFGDEMPKISSGLSDKGMDFLNNQAIHTCFIEYNSTALVKQEMGKTTIVGDLQLVEEMWDREEEIECNTQLALNCLNIIYTGLVQSKFLLLEPGKKLSTIKLNERFTENRREETLNRT
ncbi:hypothetical protein HHK36_006414 [Tetracentron sinense]|uniref:Protein kinase domain-containing protein n=1 Tax=Tetracentron sinense TaxID=13715 RepID=A0A834ZRS5_TETSI|nr:hypothetical protein HHK36_006414 [Tetracentron sinense]